MSIRLFFNRDSLSRARADQLMERLRIAVLRFEADCELADQGSRETP